MVLVEICLEGVDSAVTAFNNGADRIELCANLLEGGTTPSFGCIKQCVELVKCPIQVMIRPRGGDFCYSDLEFQQMKLDIELCKNLGVNGVVFGILNPNGRVDIERTRELVRLAHPLECTFHRAFDMTRDPVEAVQDLVEIGGIQRILTSGQEPSVLDGLELINKLIEMTCKQDKIKIMPGCGINERNMTRILKELHPGIKEIHMALPMTQDSKMSFRNHNVFMGVALSSSEYSQSVTDGSKVSTVHSTLQH